MVLPSILYALSAYLKGMAETSALAVLLFSFFELNKFINAKLAKTAHIIVLISKISVNVLAFNFLFIIFIPPLKSLKIAFLSRLRRHTVFANYMTVQNGGFPRFGAEYAAIKRLF